MNRETQLQSIAERRAPWDLAVIGGGATGAGIAVDAAARGYAVVLLEQSDFGKGTSSRSTKLVHGGVRYLQQGNIPLVVEALKERSLLLQNAPHLVRNLEFVVPNYQWWEAPFYGVGLKLYDWLAGRHGFGRSQILSPAEVLRRIPMLEPAGLRGGVLYHDGQFDDSRLLINLLQTAAEHGATILNYARVTGLTKNSTGAVNGLKFHDAETGDEFTVVARCVINAAGPFSDQVLRLDDPAAAPMIAPSQGVHVVLPREFLPGNAAIMVPHTRDGRVMFAVPWHGHVVVGTTDTPVDGVSLEPRPLAGEVDFILQTAGRYLAKPPARADLLSIFAGIRPLVKAEPGANTAALSRDHTIRVSRSGLLTIAGGKWTTYRKMAEDAVTRAAELASLRPRPCQTSALAIHGSQNSLKPADASTGGRVNEGETPVRQTGETPVPLSAARQAETLAGYGADADGIAKLMRDRPELAAPLHAALPICGAQIVWAAKYEMARTVDDALARRTRALFLNARAALEMAPATARLLAETLGRDKNWEAQQLAAFAEIAAGFLPPAEFTQAARP